MRATLTALTLSLAALGCTNPYCGALGEPCCASSGEPCAPTLSCHANLCERCDREGDYCCTDRTCDGSLLCSLGARPELCLRPCDVLTNDCPADLSCVWIANNDGLCVPFGVLGQDAQCTYISECARGLMCATHAEDPRFFCEPPCLDSSGCAGSHVCLPLSPGDTRATCY